MKLPQINHDYVEFLISSATEKIERFKQKVSSIECKIAELKQELEMVSAMIEYLSLHEDRKDLVGLFYVRGEYGTAEPEPEEFVAQFHDRKSYVASSIPRYEGNLYKRREQIKFMERDVDLLKKIAELGSLCRYRDAIVIDQ